MVIFSFVFFQNYALLYLGKRDFFDTIVIEKNRKIRGRNGKRSSTKD